MWSVLENVLCALAKNVYSIYYMPEEGQIKGYQMSIFGVPIPFITYNIKF